MPAMTSWPLSAALARRISGRKLCSSCLPGRPTKPLARPHGAACLLLPIAPHAAAAPSTSRYRVNSHLIPCASTVLFSVPAVGLATLVISQDPRASAWTL
jgi:hypothetical protein